ncbi:MAG TPA: GNAT family protein [Propionibacteriaceae bacterium]|nr:GNAT family protein [Propionibacteriaceae bacterium]
MDPNSWPMPELRLRTSDLLLRPTTEADLPAVAATLSSDATSNPRLPRFSALDESTSRAVSAHQSYWQSVGNWSPDSWRLDLVVTLGERIIGVQSLEGEDFLVLRTVDSASYLARDTRGRGWGKQARRAVLALAFGPLGADYAVTSAWHHNAASLGVSMALGYKANGESRERSDAGPGADTMVHLRLSRSDWEASGQAASVKISGFERCRPLFGL